MYKGRALMYKGCAPCQKGARTLRTPAHPCAPLRTLAHPLARPFLQVLRDLVEQAMNIPFKERQSEPAPRRRDMLAISQGLQHRDSDGETGAEPLAAGAREAV